MVGSVMVPLNLGVQGKVKLIRTDVRTGQVETFAKNNLLLSSMLNRFFTHAPGFLTSHAMSKCYIGTGTQTPTRADAGCQGTVLASSTSGETIAPLSTLGNTPLLAGSYVQIIDTGLQDRITAVACPPGAKYVARGVDSGYNVPYLLVQKRIGSSFSLLPAGKHPEDAPGHVRSISFAPNGLYMAVAHDGGSRLTIYKIAEDDTFTKLDGEGEGPDAGFSSTTYACAFSPDSTYLAVGTHSSPFITVYKRNGDAFTTVATLSTSSCYHVAWSHDGTYLAAAHYVGGLSIYKRNGDDFTKITTVDPLSEEATAGRRVVFSHDSKHLAVLHDGGDFLALYERDGDIFTRVLGTPTLPSLNPNSHDLSYGYDATTGDEVLFVVNNSTTYFDMRAYRFYQGSLKQITFPAASTTSLGKAITIDNWDWVFVGNQRLVHAARLSTEVQNALSLKRRWVFPAGVGLGSVGEVVLQTTNDTYYGVADNWVARQVFDPPITKGEFHQLDVEWEISFTKPPKWTGTFVGGQRDALTDVNWTITLNNRQFYDLVRAFGSGIFNRSSPAVWFGLSGTSVGTPSLRVGTGQDASHLALDYYGTSYGEELFYSTDVSSQLQVFDYVPGSFEREFRINFPVTLANGAIGEIILWRTYSDYPMGLLRITFDPPLDKVDTYELHLNFKISLDPS